MEMCVQCASCDRQAPALIGEDGKPDIPEDWRALHAESDPGFELYACSEDCGHVTGFVLHQSHPLDAILERRVEVVWSTDYA